MDANAMDEELFTGFPGVTASPSGDCGCQGSMLGQPRLSAG